VSANENWPDIHVAGWAETKRTLHLCAQMLGKVRLALSPPQPNWMFTALYMTPRGITTGFIPYGRSSVEAALDVFDSRITIARSDGECASVDLVSARSIAEIYAALSATIKQLDVACHISRMPQEVPDTTPFDEDRREIEYDPEAVLRWFRAATATTTVFESWRARFFGRSGIQLWWGAFDLALILFSGKRESPPTDRGYLMKYDLDAQLMNAGLYFGDAQNAPFFYGYIFPQPAGAESLPIAPAPAAWSTQLSEWVLPYETVRESSDPATPIGTFLDAIYNVCFTAAGWNRDAYTYDAPPSGAR
jgi:hypothetical protein